jgi:hypothetical protein
MAIVEKEQPRPGQIASVIVTQSTVYKPDDFKDDPSLMETIKSLTTGYAASDEASRRFSVLCCWEERHYDRGWQYLEEGNKGGWQFAGANPSDPQGNGMKEMNDSGLFPTNIYAAQGDIITSALTRGEIKVNFAPVKNKSPEDVAYADTANNYKHIWAENNCSSELQRQVMDIAWTDPRCLLWTRSVADIKNGETDDGEIKVMEKTTAHGLLESKLPMLADSLDTCGYAQIFEEVDYAVARATYPWMGKKIKPTMGTQGELEFERIARINTRIGLVGNQLLGTSGIRECTMGYTWNRPGTYYDDKVPDNHREWLLENAPRGLFVVMAGEEFVCCWEESLDDHLALGMFTRGFGQARRALGSSDIPIQKRLNIWAELWDKFLRGSIGMVLLESQAFNAEEINKLEASTTRFLEVAVPEGTNVQELCGITPQPQPVQGFFESLQYYLGPLIQSIDGGTPALFGGGEGADNTVGATQIRFQQALERVGKPWLVVNNMFAAAVYQAVKCCAENGNSELHSNVNGTYVSVDPNILKSNSNGKCKCKAETTTMIPESGSQREAKVLQILSMSGQDPQVASLISSASNAREIVKALHIDDVITINEADSEDLALEDIDILLSSAPLINPQWDQLQQKVEEMTNDHEQVKQGAAAMAQSGNLNQDIVGKGQQMAEQLEQLQQQLQQTPQYIPSVEVPTDDSQDHATIAATVFSWMQGPEGRKLRRAAAQESPDNDPQHQQNWGKWTNVFLYWQTHNKLAQQFTQGKPQPKVSVTGKLAPDQVTQLLLDAGINVNPKPTPEPSEVEQETIDRQHPDGTGFRESKTRVRKKL